jgi:hypothetical protein
MNTSPIQTETELGERRVPIKVSDTAFCFVVLWSNPLRYDVAVAAVRVSILISDITM